MDYNINPCAACIEKLNNGRYDVNNINNCCYETLGAFRGVQNVNQIRDLPEAQNCVACVNNAIGSIGRDTCDMKISPPPLFNQVPHFFPGHLNREKDIKKAFDMCVSDCNNTNFPNSCISNCVTDANAVQNNASVKEGFKNLSGSNNSSFPTSCFMYITLMIFCFYLIKKALETKYTPRNHTRFY
jgi:hypothetical protein